MGGSTCGKKHLVFKQRKGMKYDAELHISGNPEVIMRAIEQLLLCISTFAAVNNWTDIYFN